MFGIFPFGVPYFAQPQSLIVLVTTINYNTPVPKLQKKAPEAPRMAALSANDKPNIKQ